MLYSFHVQSSIMKLPEKRHRLTDRIHTTFSCWIFPSRKEQFGGLVLSLKLDQAQATFFIR
jgi:hypothetical protein